MILYVMEGKIVRRLIEDFLIYFSQDLSIGRQARRDVLAFEKEIYGAFQESLEITAINQLRKARHMCRGQNEHVAKLCVSRSKDVGHHRSLLYSIEGFCAQNGR